MTILENGQLHRTNGKIEQKCIPLKKKKFYALQILKHLVHILQVYKFNIFTIPYTHIFISLTTKPRLESELTIYDGEILNYGEKYGGGSYFENSWTDFDQIDKIPPPLKYLQIGITIIPLFLTPNAPIRFISYTALPIFPK